MLERIATLKARHPEFDWLMRTDETRGFMVHLHAEPVKDGFGITIGFNRSFIEYAPILEEAWDKAFSRLERWL